MDDTAIKLIQNTALAASLNGQYDHLGVVPLPSGYILESVERFQSVPDSFKGRFETDVIGQFIDYINNTATDHSAIFINPRASVANAIIDMGRPGSPEWGRHRAQLVLRNTPDYDVLLVNNHDPLSQQQFIDFIEDWSDHISPFNDDGSSLEVKSAIRRLRALKVSKTASDEQTQNNFSGSRSALEAIEIKASGEAPPALFKFFAQPHHGFSIREFVCEIRALTTGKEVQLKYRIKSLEAVQNAIAEELEQIITQNITVDGVGLYIGDMTYQ